MCQLYLTFFFLKKRKLPWKVFLRIGDEYFMRHLFLSLIQVFNNNYIFIQLEKERRISWIFKVFRRGKADNTE